MKIKKIFFLLMVSFALAFGDVNLVSAQAGCQASCNSNTVIGCGFLCSGCGCYYSEEHADPAGDGGACIVEGGGANGIRKCQPIAGIFDVSCSDANMQCKESNCNGLSGNNGVECLVTMGTSSIVPMFHCTGMAESSGAIWDASDAKCVICNNITHEEQNSCGDSAGIYLNKVTQICEGLSDGQFESACGADSACDEVMGAGSSCTSGLACENGGNPNCTASDHCDVNGHCCIDPNVIDLVTGACVGAAACNCGADGCCNGIGCIATGGDPDCDCVTDFGGTNCGIGGSCDVAAGSSQITNHNGLGVCCTGACAGGCTYSCSTGLCFLALANASKIVGEDCCDGTQCYECDSGFVWNGVLNACMPLGGGIPDMGHSTDHGNYFKYDKDVDLVFTEGAEFLLRIAGGLALFILVLGGLFYMVSGSNPDGQTKAKKVVTYAVIGLAIVLVSYIIIVVVENIAV